MKLLVTSTTDNKNQRIDKRFGRAKYFTIYNTEDNSYKYIENEGKLQSNGAGSFASQQIINLDVDIVITGNVGPKALTVLKSAAIQAFKTEEVTVEKAINAYLDNTLEEIKTPGPSHAGMR